MRIFIYLNNTIIFKNTFLFQIIHTITKQNNLSLRAFDESITQENTFQLNLNGGFPLKGVIVVKSS